MSRFTRLFIRLAFAAQGKTEEEKIELHRRWLDWALSPRFHRQDGDKDLWKK